MPAQIFPQAKLLLHIGGLELNEFGLAMTVAGYTTCFIKRVA